MTDRIGVVKIHSWLVSVLWIILLVGIPITSFPPLAEVIGGVTVSPFSILPLILLIPTFLIPDLIKGGRLASITWPALFFGLAVLLSAGIAVFLPLTPFKGENIIGRLFHAGATLAVGMGFYFVASRYPLSNQRWKITLGAIYLGGILALLWATIQAGYILEGLNNVPKDLNELHRLVSIRDLERNRVTGLAFEPSWFGDQIVLIYLPIWVGAIITGRSLFPWHKGLISLEFGLSLWAAWLLLLTRSRVSIAALLIGLGLGLLVLFWKLADWLFRVFFSRHLETSRSRYKWLLRSVMIMLAIAIMVGIAYSLVLVGADIDWRMRRIMNLPSELPGIRIQHPFEVGYEVANRFAFAERLVYWRASLQAFSDYPLTGVGLGNAGFLFSEGVPAYGYDLIEIRSFLDSSSPNFPNPKNLWVRLLSETGIIGTALYLSWLILLACFAWYLFTRGAGEYRWIAIAALLSLAMQVVEGFSLDSFALPQTWIMNGLLTAVITSRSKAILPTAADNAPMADSPLIGR